jgi:MFS transporter, FSR family, fosmidomycin resistance protein
MTTLKKDAKIIGLISLAHATSHFTQMMLAPLFPLFMKEFDLSFSQIGFLVSILYVVSSIGQASSGFLVDRVGARPVLFGSFVLFVVAALVVSISTSYGGLMAAMVLIGVGNAPFHPADFTVMNQRVSAPRLGYAYSLHGVTGYLGWSLAPLFFVGITALADWRTAYVCAALLYALILLVLVLNRSHLKTEVVRTTSKAEHAAAGTVSQDFAFLKLPVVWLCFGFFMLATMTLAVVQSFSVSILQTLHSVSFEMANATLTAYMLAGAAGMLMGGWVAAKFPSRSDVIVARAMAAGAALLVLCATGWLGSLGTCAVLACTGLAIGIGGPSRDMMIKNATPKGATGRVYGTVYSGMDVGFALAPLIFGSMMDKGWYAAVLVGAAVTLVLGVYLALVVGRQTQTETI